MTIVDRRYSVAEGTAIKAPCRAATTANITLSGEQTIDGVAVVEGDRVLVKNQTDGRENGIYTASTGNWSRGRDFDGAYDVVTGTRVFITEGTVSARHEYAVTTTGTITIGTTSIAFQIDFSGDAAASAAASAASATEAQTAETNAETAETNAETAQAAAEAALAAMQIIPPQGRLTLSATNPVLTADVSAGTTIYYLPFTGAYVPIPNATLLTPTSIGTGLSLALDSDSGHTGYHQSGKNFDLWLINSSGAKLGTGPAWSSDTSRGTGTGTTEWEWWNGFRVNKNSMTVRIGSASGDTVTVNARCALLVGSFRATSNGTTKMVMHPAAVAGGTANVLGLSNVFHRRLVRAVCIDGSSTWTYTSPAVSPANAAGGTGGGLNNRISFIDAVQESSLHSIYRTTMAPFTSAATAATVGVQLDGTNNLGISGSILDQAASTDTQIGMVSSGERRDHPQLGFHFYQALEQTTAVAVEFFGNGFSGLSLELEM